MAILSAPHSYTLLLQLCCNPDTYNTTNTRSVLFCLQLLAYYHAISGPIEVGKHIKKDLRRHVVVGEVPQCADTLKESQEISKRHTAVWHWTMERILGLSHIQVKQGHNDRLEWPCLYPVPSPVTPPSSFKALCTMYWLQLYLYTHTSTA